MMISDEEEGSMEQNEPSESIAKRNMIALNMQNDAEEEEEIDHFIGEFFDIFLLFAFS